MKALAQVNSMAEVRLSAGADLRPEAVTGFEKKFGGKGYPSVQAMCESDEIDVVWVATPNVYHAEHAVIAAECGKHIIVEKPMAVTLEEANRMISAADRNGVRLVQGHSKIYSHAIQKMREVVHSGSLGRLIQINTWNANDWMQRPRLPAEVDTSQGGGVCFRQGPHQADIVRYIGGGLVKNVRAITGCADPNFNTEGHYTSFLEFADGAAATMVFNGYGHLDMSELTWNIGEGGKRLSAEEIQARSAHTRLNGPVDMDTKYSSPQSTGANLSRKRDAQSIVGLTVVACERGVIRQSPDGIYVYSEAGREEILCEFDSGRQAVLRDLYYALAEKRPVLSDGRWGKASLEVCLAMLQSSTEGREIALAAQVRSVESRPLPVLQ